VKLAAPSFAVLLATLADIAAGAEPPSAITMSESIPFEEDVAAEVGLLAAPGGNAVRFETQCDLQTQLAQAIALEVRDEGVEVMLVENLDGATGPLLHVAIEGMLGFTGAWKGPKSLILRGRLTDGDTLIGSFVARATEKGIFKNSCEQFEAAGKKAARDIAEWVKAPKRGARIGRA
jgi:hypothetical protein